MAKLDDLLAVDNNPEPLLPSAAVAAAAQDASNSLLDSDAFKIDWVVMPSGLNSYSLRDVTLNFTLSAFDNGTLSGESFPNVANDMHACVLGNEKVCSNPDH